MTLRLQPGATLVADTLDLTDPTAHLSVRVLTPDGTPAAALAVRLTRAADGTGPALGAARDVTGTTRTVFPLADLGPDGPALVAHNLTSQPLLLKVSVVE